MSDNIISLDWRYGPAATEVVLRLQKLFTELDENGGVNLRLSQSVGQKAVCLVVKNGHHLVMRQDHRSYRKYSGQEQYWTRAYAIASTLVKMQADEQMLKIRFIEYKDVFPNTEMKLEQVKRILLDLALTIEVHPLALGVLTEDRGLFYLPDGISIEATIVMNVIAWHKTDESAEYRARNTERKQLKHSPNAKVIPQLIEKMTVKVQKKRSVRAVVVREHANLSSILINDGFGTNNCIVVMTKGYPCHSTAEFLHMLSQDPMLADVPFLFFSDHDFHGFQIFSILKYGCRTSAWLSEILVCPQLQWLGPSRNDLLRSPSLYRSEWESQYRSDNPNEQDDAVLKAADEWEGKLSRRINRKFVPATKKDRELYRGFSRTGWLQHEPLISAELETILKIPSRFSTASMVQVGTRYLRTFLETKIAEMSPVITTLSRARVSFKAPAKRSPVGEKFKQIPSQSQISQQSDPVKEQAAQAALTNSDITLEQFQVLMAETAADM